MDGQRFHECKYGEEIKFCRLAFNWFIDRQMETIIWTLNFKERNSNNINMKYEFRLSNEKKKWQHANWLRSNYGQRKRSDSCTSREYATKKPFEFSNQQGRRSPVYVWRLEKGKKIETGLNDAVHLVIPHFLKLGLFILHLQRFDYPFRICRDSLRYPCITLNTTAEDYAFDRIRWW